MSANRLTPERCACNDPYCNARPGDARPGMTIPCFVCQKWVCLSCSVRMNVPASGAGTVKTFGYHHVCHDCALTLPEGSDFVHRHLSTLGGGVPLAAGGTRRLPPRPLVGQAQGAVNYTPPKAEVRAMTVEWAKPGETYKVRKQNKRERRREKREREARERRLEGGEVVYYTGQTARTAEPATNYPATRMRLLGYA